MWEPVNQAQGVVKMYPNVEDYVSKLSADFDAISEVRKSKLLQVSSYIKNKLEAGQTAKLTFICTHNSRRSHLAQIWTTVASHYYEVNNIEAYSGGTEATAFNPRAVAALERAGFQIADPGGENPKYEVKFSEDIAPMVCFSKIFDHSINPVKEFAAIMTCSDADENCPFVPGADVRLSVTYQDPKESDGTTKEAETYDERCRQIASEMFYLISNI